MAKRGEKPVDTAGPPASRSGENVRRPTPAGTPAGTSPDIEPSAVERGMFMLLVVTVTLAFAWILSPYFSAILWAVVLAILFAPIYRRLLKLMRKRATPAALATLVVILVIVIVPLALISASLVQEATGLVKQIRSGEIDFVRSFRELQNALPGWMTTLLERFGLSDIAAIQERLSTSLAKGSEAIATRAFSFGQDALDMAVSFFIMLYLLFFMLRDGRSLGAQVRRAVPLHDDMLRGLSEKFMVVTRATMKGNVIVAMAQGALGGVLFWFLGIHAPVLWGVVMAFLSLLPAVGAAIVWLPVAIYYLSTGSMGTGLFIVAYGVLVIGLVDNVLRPLLVGKDTQMPDYLVLLSTIGGMAIFGFNGFVIGPVVAAMFIAIWDIFTQSHRVR